MVIFFFPQNSYWGCSIYLASICPYSFYWSLWEGKVKCKMFQNIEKSWESVQFSHLVVSNSLRPRGLQHDRLPCQLPEPTQTHVHHISDAIQPSNLSSPSPTALSLSQHYGLFKWVGSLHQVATVLYWSFSFSISPSNEYSVLISFGIDWLDLLAVQGTLKSLLQFYSSKGSILQCSPFFIVQLSYVHTWLLEKP